LIILLFILNKPSKENVSQLVITACLLFFNIISQFFIPVYERLLSKAINNSGLETILEENLPPILNAFIIILLPTFLMEVIFLYNVSGRKHFKSLMKILYFIYKAFFIAYQLIKALRIDQTEWLLLYIPRIMYILIPIFILIKYSLPYSLEGNWILCSIFYSLQLILGTSTCPLGYFILFIEIFLFQKLAHEKDLMLSLFCYLQSVGAFYITQHIPRFTHLQLFSGFIGFQKFHLGITPILVLLNTTGPAILSICLFEACQAESKIVVTKKKDKRIVLRKDDILSSLSIVILLWMTQLLFMNIFVVVERENMHFADHMAPKFIFDVCIALSVAIYFLFKNF